MPSAAGAPWESLLTFLSGREGQRRQEQELCSREQTVELRRFLESDSQGVGSLHIFGSATPELSPLGGVRNSRSLRLHGIKLTKF